MNWNDEALVISARPHGESGALVMLLTRGRGRWRGLVRGGRSRRLRPVLQPGNRVRAAWRARLEEQLGGFTVEPLEMVAGRLIDDGLALAGLAVLCSHMALLPEREAQPRLYEAATMIISRLREADLWPALLARFEMELLAALGFGLDLSGCALGGEGELAWVSPLTGRAASRAAGEPWAEKLLPLPGFLVNGAGAPPGRREVLQALELSGHFLGQRVYEPRGLAPPLERQWILEHLAGQGAGR